MNHLAALAAVRSAYVAHQNAAHMTYTEGPLRWSGITQDRRGWKGSYPQYADCSSFYTWCVWDATRYRDRPDNVNGQAWQAGYTGTMIQHGTTVDPSALLPADAVFYGWDASLGAPMHVALYVGAGRVVSHGSQGGPYLIPVGYRGDIYACRRYL